MNPEDIPDEYGSDSTVSSQLRLPEWANAILDEHSEAIYGNNQHKGEIAAYAILLLHKIQEGDGVSPEFLASIGLGAPSADWSDSSSQASRKIKFSTDEQYLDNLPLDASDELDMDEYDYEQLCKDTYAKRIPAIAAVTRNSDENPPVDGVKNQARGMFYDKHRKTVGRYVEELETEVLDGGVHGLNPSIAHLFEEFGLENGDFSTTESESLNDYLQREFSDDELPKWADPLFVTDGFDGFYAHVQTVVDWTVDTLAELYEEVSTASYVSSGEIRRAYHLSTILALLPDMIALNLDINDFGTAEEDMLLTYVEEQVEDGRGYIESIQEQG